MLAVAGGKGGVGKTITALGVGAALARRDHDTVVVDADRDMPDLGRRAGIDGGGVAAVADGASIRAVAREAASVPVRVLPATPGLERRTVRRALTRLGVSDPSVVVDCPAGASRDAAIPLRIADRTLVVTTPTSPSLRAAAKTAAMARRLDAPPVGALLAKSDESLDAESLLGCPVVATTPAASDPLANRRARESFSRFVCQLI